MSALPDGGPAFPKPDTHYPSGIEIGSPGMTLVQWYAGMALKGILANPEANRAWNEVEVSSFCLRQAQSMVQLQMGDEILLEGRLRRARREIEVLRLYGNKDCTAQADEVLKKEGIK